MADLRDLGCCDRVGPGSDGGYFGEEGEGRELGSAGARESGSLVAFSVEELDALLVEDESMDEKE